MSNGALPEQKLDEDEGSALDIRHRRNLLGSGFTTSHF